METELVGPGVGGGLECACRWAARTLIFSLKISYLSPESATVLERLWHVAMETLWWLRFFP